MSRPTDLPDWATNANYSAGTYSGQSTKSTPASGIVQNGFMGGYGLPAEWLNYILNNHAAWINYLAASVMWYGTGLNGSGTMDGAATVAGMAPVGNVYTATSDLFFVDLTINNGITFKPNGYRVYCTGTLTLTGTATISIDGQDASGAIGGAGGGTGILVGGGGVNGAAANNNGTSITTTNALGGAGGSGGDGNGTPHAGGTVSATLSASKGSIYLPQSLQTGMLFGASGITVPIGGTGGASAGGGAANAGGGSGGGAGILLIMARVVSCSATCHLYARGGSGGAAGGAGGGGGGGGGGGFIIMGYGLSSGASPPSSQTNVTGGGGGTAGAGGVNGTAGSAGTAYMFTL